MGVQVISTNNTAELFEAVVEVSGQFKPIYVTLDMSRYTIYNSDLVIEKDTGEIIPYKTKYVPNAKWVFTLTNGQYVIKIYKNLYLRSLETIGMVDIQEEFVKGFKYNYDAPNRHKPWWEGFKWVGIAAFGFAALILTVEIVK